MDNLTTIRHDLEDFIIHYDKSAVYDWAIQHGLKLIDEVEHLEKILKLKRPRTWERVMYILKGILEDEEASRHLSEVISQVYLAYKLMESDIDE